MARASYGEHAKLNIEISLNGDESEARREELVFQALRAVSKVIHEVSFLSECAINERVSSRASS